MSADHRSIEQKNQTASAEVDLGLPLPKGLDVRSLFPGDRLLRLHPNWFIEAFSREDETFNARIKDYATEKEFSLSGSFVFNAAKGHLLDITLTGMVDVSIVFLNRNNMLSVGISSVKEISATDPLLLWVRAIKEYLRIYTRQTPVTLFWRLVMNRMVLQMNPSQRKICMMLVRITFLEILVILFIVIGYVIFVL